MTTEYDRKALHSDEWMGSRVDRALDAIRHAEAEGLETALDLIAFAEDVLDHYEPRSTSPAPSPREAEICTCGAWSDRNLAHPPGCPALEHIPPGKGRDS